MLFSVSSEDNCLLAESLDIPSGSDRKANKKKSKKKAAGKVFLLFQTQFYMYFCQRVNNILMFRVARFLLIWTILSMRGS